MMAISPSLDTFGLRDLVAPSQNAQQRSSPCCATYQFFRNRSSILVGSASQTWWTTGLWRRNFVCIHNGNSHQRSRRMAHVFTSDLVSTVFADRALVAPDGA